MANSGSSILNARAFQTNDSNRLTELSYYHRAPLHGKPRPRTHRGLNLACLCLVLLFSGCAVVDHPMPAPGPGSTWTLPATTVPLPAATVQVCVGPLGWVATVTAYPAPLATRVGKVNAPFAATAI